MSETCGVDYWLKDLMPRLPGAEESFVKHETFATLREFCEDGRAWIDTLTNLSSKANNPNIYLDPLPDGNKVGYVLDVQYRPSGSTQAKSLDVMTSWPALATRVADDPLAYYMLDTGHIRLNPIPGKDHEKSYDVTMTLIPCDINVRLPIEFSSHWRDAIIDGVCSRMMLMVAKPWTSLKLGEFHGRKFRNHVKRARSITDSRWSRGDAQWVFPQNFAGQRQRYYT